MHHSYHKTFDLNIDKILTHWTTEQALRELISNALDETNLIWCPEPVIKLNNNNILTIRDFGRGIEAKHLINNMSNEKVNDPSVIGNYGIGLKDAIVTLYNNNCDISIQSSKCEIKFKLLPKNNFNELNTLHAIINENETINTGTIITITNITPEQLRTTKDHFLYFSTAKPIKITNYGEIYQRASSRHSNIYVNGVNILYGTKLHFKFDYNIIINDIETKKTLMKNRDRNNLSKTLYMLQIANIIISNRIGKINDPRKPDKIIQELIKELDKNKPYCEEMSNDDIFCHVIQYCDNEYIFTTHLDVMVKHHAVEKAKKKHKIIIVENHLYPRVLSVIRKLNSDFVMTLDSFYKESITFEYNFININDLEPEERRIFDKTDIILDILGIVPLKQPIKIVSKLENEHSSCGGIHRNGEIIIARSQLKSMKIYMGTLLHEYTHAISGYKDNTLNFEIALTDCIGSLAEYIIKNQIC